MKSATLYSRALLAAVACLLAPIVIAQESEKCPKGQVDVVVVVDTSSENADLFQKQQDRLAAVIGLLDSLTPNAKLAVVSYNSQAEVIASLTSPDAAHIAKALTTIEALKPTATATSTVPALEAAINELKSNGRGGPKIVILAHDGKTNDTLEQVLEEDEKLKETGANVFVVTADAEPDLTVLVGYAGDRARVYATEEDKNAFVEQLRNLTDAVFCTESAVLPTDTASSKEKTSSTAAKEEKSKEVTETEAVPIAPQEEAAPTTVKAEVGGKATSPKPKSSKEASKETTDGQALPSGDCEFSKVDLMILLDTSGSVADAFAAERAFAEDLIKALPLGSFDSGDLQVSVISFSEVTKVALPFQPARSQKQTIREIGSIKHTGGSTRISPAIQQGIGELDRAKRADAKQIFILISDGRGSDFWTAAANTGKQLQATNAEIFSVTQSSDYNIPELVLYAGSKERVFVGPKKNDFVAEASRRIRDCLNPSPHVTKPGQVKTKVVTELLSDSCPDNVDLVFIIDSSGSVTDDFVKERKFATDLIEAAPAGDFDERIAVAAVRFSKSAELVFPFGEVKGQAQLIEHINNINHTGGATSAVSGVNTAVQEINAHHRKGARLVVVLISGTVLMIWPWKLCCRFDF
uniref:VWFA domain-containing protein n=1 Tax=Plectus sambesii TaxID=2011161 RepID=A0A914W167_9BILA